MTRLPRYVIPGQPQHIIQRGKAGDLCRGCGTEARFGDSCLCLDGLPLYVTLPIHLLATPESDHSISKVFQSVGRRYVQYVNFTCRRCGILWEVRYRATVVHSEQYLLTLMRYVELNPVRAGMVTYAGDYLWSRYCHNAYGKSEVNADWWLMAHEEYLGLGRNKAGRQIAYRQLGQGGISANLKFPRKNGPLSLQRIENTCKKAFIACKNIGM